jgi:hypothetical protein
VTAAGSLRSRLIVGTLIWVFSLLVGTTIIGMVLIHYHPHIVESVHYSALVVFATIVLFGGISVIQRGLSPFTDLRERLGAVR